METQRAVATGLFDNFVTSFTGGLIPDIKTAMFAVAGLFLILFVLDIITKLITGVSPSASIADWWEESGDEAGYSDYRKKRLKEDYYRERYSVERYNRLNKGRGVSWDAPSRKEYR